VAWSPSAVRTSSIHSCRGQGQPSLADRAAPNRAGDPGAPAGD
jgi:hypothetical protein